MGTPGGGDPAEAPLRGRHVLVTGGAGFIGRHLIEHLLEAGCEVEGWGRAELRDDRIAFSAVDLRNPGEVMAAAERSAFDSIVHLASGGRGIRSSAAATQEVLMTGSLVDLMRSRDVRRMVTLGSADQYGFARAPQTENAAVSSPVNLYAAAKTASDVILNFARESEDASIVTLRPFVVYGARAPRHMFISQLIRSCLLGQDFAMSAGTQERDFVYVDDVCRAIMMALMRRHIPSPVYNVGTGVATRLLTLAEIVREMTEANIKILTGAQTRQNDPEVLVADTTLARQELGWEAEVPLRIGIERLVEYERAHGS